MKINEIKEVGYYCQVGDTERLGIYEVIKNTDKEWLKNNPKDIFLIDAWVYNYKDHDDRKVYTTGGTLINPNIVNCSFEVEKINNIKYKLLENDGMFLIEDKPTYKEQLQRKEQALNAILELVEENKNTCQYQGICKSILDIINEAKRTANNEQ